MNGTVRTLGVLVLAVAGFFLPTLLGGSALVVDTLVAIAIFAAMSYGLDIILSDLGEISLVHTAFFATGAYAAAILTVTYGQSAWVGLAGAVIASLVLAVLLGLITLRTRESFGPTFTRTLDLCTSPLGPRVTIRSRVSGNVSRTMRSTSAVSRSVSSIAVPAGSSMTTANSPWSPRTMNSAPMRRVSAMLPTKSAAAPATTVFLRRRAQASTSR